MKETYGMEVAMVYSAAGCHFTCAASEVEARPMPKVFTNVVSTLLCYRDVGNI
jgi:hypothetical protein